MNKNTFKHFQKPLFTCLTAILLFTALFTRDNVSSPNSPAITIASIYNETSATEDPCDLINLSE